MEAEIEVKVLNMDLDQLEKKLIDLGAKLIAKELQVNTIIDTKDGYIQNKLNSYLRIRETMDLLSNRRDIRLTLKKNVGKEKARRNIEMSTVIDDKETMINIFKELGYHVIEEGIKERKSYVYDGIRFDLDRWDESTYPYAYMEIEVKEQKDLEKAVRLLNIDKGNISTKSIMELKEELKRNRYS